MFARRRTALAAANGEQPAHILFLSYIVEELDAAQAVGFRTGWLLRPPQALPALPRHPAYADFDAVTP